jgi:hypothetical protein
MGRTPINYPPPIVRAIQHAVAAAKTREAARKHPEAARGLLKAAERYSKLAADFLATLGDR